MCYDCEGRFGRFHWFILVCCIIVIVLAVIYGVVNISSAGDAQLNIYGVSAIILAFAILGLIALFCHNSICMGVFMWGCLVIAIIVGVNLIYTLANQGLQNWQPWVFNIVFIILTALCFYSAFRIRHRQWCC